MMDLVPIVVQSVATAKPLTAQMRGGYTLTGIITALFSAGTFGVCLRALILVVPKLREMGIGQRKDDLTRLTERVDKIESENKSLRTSLAEAERVTNEVRIKAQTEINEIRMSTQATNTACQLMAGELRRINQDNPVLRQALDLMKQAASPDMGWGEAARGLAMLPGIKRELEE